MGRVVRFLEWFPINVQKERAASFRDKEEPGLPEGLDDV
jgi:hypothetical protein